MTIAAYFAKVPEDTNCTWSTGLTMRVNETWHRLHRPIWCWWDVCGWWNRMTRLCYSYLAERHFTQSRSTQSNFRRDLHNKFTSMKSQTTRRERFFGFLNFTKISDGWSYSPVYATLFLAYCTVILFHKSDEQSAAIFTTTRKHANWLRKTISTSYNLRFVVTSFTRH